MVVCDRIYTYYRSWRGNNKTPQALLLVFTDTVHKECHGPAALSPRILPFMAGEYNAGFKNLKTMNPGQAVVILS